MQVTRWFPSGTLSAFSRIWSSDRNVMWRRSCHTEPMISMLWLVWPIDTDNCYLFRWTLCLCCTSARYMLSISLPISLPPLNVQTLCTNSCTYFQPLLQPPGAWKQSNETFGDEQLAILLQVRASLITNTWLELLSAVWTMRWGIGEESRYDTLTV